MIEDIFIENLPFNMVERTILKQSCNKSVSRNNIVSFSAFNIDGASYSMETLEISKSIPIDLAVKILDMVADKLYSIGNIPKILITNLSFTRDIKESYIKKLTAAMSIVARDLGAVFVIGNANFYSGTDRILIDVLGVGEAFAGITGKYKKRAEIVLAGYLGLYGTAYLINQKRDILNNTLSTSFLDNSLNLLSNINTYYMSKIAIENSAIFCQNIGRGGIEAALYEMSEHFNSGFEVDMEKFILLQETIEVCETLKKNPYKINSYGSMLILTDNSKHLCEEFEKNGIISSKIGELCSNFMAKKVIKYSEVSFLERP